MWSTLSVFLWGVAGVALVLHAVRRYGSRQAAAARARQLARAGRVASVLVLLAAPASASAVLHCEEWPHWQEVYDNLANYDHTRGEAVEWLQLAGCPPVWAENEGRWLPNGSDCNAPCEIEDPPVEPAAPAVEATITGGCAPECTTEPADVPAAAHPRREPLTFTVNIDTRRAVIDAASSASSASNEDADAPCSCERERLRVGQSTSCTYTGPGDVQWEVNGVGFPTGQINLERLTVASDESGQMVVNWQPGKHCDSVTFRRHWLKSPWLWIAGSVGGLGLHAAFGGGGR